MTVENDYRKKPRHWPAEWLALLEPWTRKPLTPEGIAILTASIPRSIDAIRKHLTIVRKQAGVTLDGAERRITLAIATLIREEVAKGTRIVAIARMTGVSVKTVGHYVRNHLGTVRVKKVEAPPIVRTVTRSWDPLPVGHAITWGAITAGTSMDGTQCPFF